MKWIGTSSEYACGVIHLLDSWAIYLICNQGAHVSVGTFPAEGAWVTRTYD